MHRWKGKRTPECSAQVACEGNYLRGERMERGICAACEKAQAKRGKEVPPRGLKLEPQNAD